MASAQACARRTRITQLRIVCYFCLATFRHVVRTSGTRLHCPQVKGKLPMATDQITSPPLDQRKKKLTRYGILADRKSVV